MGRLPARMFRLPLLFALSILPLVSQALEWKELTPIPDASGFAGSFAGVSGGALIVAGGTNFPDKKPWEGGTKVWYDDVFVLQQPEGEWRKAGKLPKANGYGLSITTGAGVIIIGGGNATEHFREVTLLQWNGTTVHASPLPALPEPCAFMTGALSGGTIFVCGGIEKPDATKAMNSLWSLNLADLDAGWKTLSPVPSAGRILAAAGAHGGAFFLFSGAAVSADAKGKSTREWLRDAWMFSLDSGWKRLADPPRVAVAAPSPLPLSGTKLLVIGGDDGALASFEPKEKHPGFPRSVLSYDTKTDVWTKEGEVPFSLVTTNAVIWNERIVIPGGEARPGVRSPAVWSQR
jgi:N-acetylneuraminate epimerase